MSNKYYQIEDDLSIENRWMVGELNLPVSFAWDDIESKSLIDAVNWKINVLLKGDPLDVTVIDFGLLMVKKSFIHLLPANEIDYKQIKIKNDKGGDIFYLLAVKNIIECVDRNKSEYTLWEDGNDIRPDLAGKYKSIYKLRINYKKVTPFSILIVKEYKFFRIVSKEVKEQFEKQKLKGITFIEV